MRFRLENQMKIVRKTGQSIPEAPREDLEGQKFDQERPRWAKRVPRVAQERPRRGPRASQEHPGHPKSGQKVARGDPRAPKECPKVPQERPTGGPRGVQKRTQEQIDDFMEIVLPCRRQCDLQGSGCSRERPERTKMRPRTAKRAQEQTKVRQERPTKSKKRPKSAQESPKSAQEHPKSTPRVVLHAAGLRSVSCRCPFGPPIGSKILGLRADLRKTNCNDYCKYY
jgi:hypothetical protein